MKIYTFTLPKFTNKGERTDKACTSFEVWAARKFGGFTRRECFGAWLDTDTNEVQFELVYEYAIGINDTKDFAVSDTIAKARELFPDQKCFAWQCDGQIYFEDRVTGLTTS